MGNIMFLFFIMNLNNMLKISAQMRLYIDLPHLDNGVTSYIFNQDITNSRKRTGVWSRKLKRERNLGDSEWGVGCRNIHRCTEIYGSIMVIYSYIIHIQRSGMSRYN